MKHLNPLDEAKTTTANIGFASSHFSLVLLRTRKLWQFVLAGAVLGREGGRYMAVWHNQGKWSSRSGAGGDSCCRRCCWVFLFFLFAGFLLLVGSSSHEHV